MTLQDDVSREIDRRKLEDVISDGIMTRDEIMNAPIVIECPRCKFEADASNDVCPNCHVHYDAPR